ncbi:MAG TPA: HK97 family phage prohead protease [Planctomycetaceae bacterium]|nr:HK97 family phage prohead protease [Planctomycetaceae bacterium]
MTPKDAASILPRKTIEGAVTSIDANGSFSMYALVFGNVDRQGDVIEAMAVTNVDELVKDGWIALNHVQADMPIALIDSAVQDGHGLKVDGRFHSHPRAQEVRSYIKERLDAGKGVKTSIGYLVPIDGERYEKDDGRTVRHISKLSVYEASFVNLPANPAAEVLAAKSHDGLDPVESEEEVSAAKVLQEVKRVLGLSSKSSYKADGEDVEKLRGMTKAISDHGDALEAASKSFKLMSASHKAMSEEMTKCLKNVTSGQQQDKDPDNDGDEADKDDDEEQDKDDDAEDTEDAEEEDKPKGKSRKAPEVKADDSEEVEEQRALKAFRNDLKRRSLALKFPSRTG